MKAIANGQLLKSVKFSGQQKESKDLEHLRIAYATAALIVILASVFMPLWFKLLL